MTWDDSSWWPSKIDAIKLGAGLALGEDYSFRSFYLPNGVKISGVYNRFEPSRSQFGLWHISTDPAGWTGGYDRGSTSGKSTHHFDDDLEFRCFLLEQAKREVYL